MRNFFNPQVIALKTMYYQSQIAPKLSQGDGDKMYTGEGAWFDLASFQTASQDLVTRVEQRDAFLETAINNYLNVPQWGSQPRQQDAMPGGEEPSPGEVPQP